MRGRPRYSADRSGNCALCGTWRKILCRDRIVPGREGGTYAPENIQWICANCHQDKTATEQSATHKGRQKNPEWLAKIAAANRGRVTSPETKLKISEATTMAMTDPAIRKKISDKARARWASRGGPPNKGQAMSAEQKTKVSEGLKAYFKDNPQEKNEPWVALGISKTTWYRRQALADPEKREALKAYKRDYYHRNADKEREAMRKRYRGRVNADLSS